MATGGGTPRDTDFSKTWRNASAFMDKDEPADDTPRQRAVNTPMDQNSDPGDLLHRNMQDMSINRDLGPTDPEEPEDEVSDPPSIISSSESLSDIPSFEGSEDEKIKNKTAIFVADKYKDRPKTSTPKGVNKTPSSSTKTVKPKSLVNSLKNVKSDRHSTSLRIDTFLINLNQTKNVPEAAAPDTPNILDWYDAVEKTDSIKNDKSNTKSTKKPPQVSGRSTPLPQRGNKTTKRKRIGTDSTCIATASSGDNVTVDGLSDVSDVNSPPPQAAEEDTNEHKQGDSQTIPWLLGHYDSKKPLPESLVGKKVRFQTNADLPNNDQPINNTELK